MATSSKASLIQHQGPPGVFRPGRILQAPRAFAAESVLDVRARFGTLKRGILSSGRNSREVALYEADVN